MLWTPEFRSRPARRDHHRDSFSVTSRLAGSVLSCAPRNLSAATVASPMQQSSRFPATSVYWLVALDGFFSSSGQWHQNRNKQQATSCKLKKGKGRICLCACCSSLSLSLPRWLSSRSPFMQPPRWSLWTLWSRWLLWTVWTVFLSSSQFPVPGSQFEGHRAIG